MTLKTIVACSLAIAAAGAFLPAVAQAQNTYSYTYNGLALPIYRDSANIITVANLFVPRAVQISKVTVNIQVDYPRPGDLNVFVYSPILTRTKLLERNCGTQGSLVDVTFDDAAPTRYSESCPTAPGTFRGNEPVSNFNGQNALGIWSLAIENNGSDEFFGYLRGFTVTVTGTTVVDKPVTRSNAVYNAAGFQPASVAPGELVNILGVNMGPNPAVSAPSGDQPTTLGGVQVTFDGTPAPISYASPYVATVQVPFTVQPGGQTMMRVVFQNTSDPVALDVLNAVPGVYTKTADGKGPVTAVNGDGTMNSAAQPARKGGMIVLYATGLGAVNPALDAGKTPPASPLSNATWPVSVVVDGQNATVLFAGAAPGFPGLYQINAQLPANVGSGARPLVVFAAGAPSQDGVTIYLQ